MVKTRFAPSPTGYLHVGGLRTAIFAYALAKHNKGKFILRIEDTDKAREVAGAKEKIFETLKIFGIAWDEEYVQSERVPTGIYKKAAERLVEAGFAYRDEGAIRIKINKGEDVGYRDFALKKDINWKTDTLDELVLLKSDGFPTYHLAVVVDDHEMGITHVLRGHDWMPSTPLHLLVYKYLGYDRPEIGHLTDILDPEGGKLSKRKGASSCEELLANGYLPEAILNFVMLLGWAPKDDREMFSLKEFVEVFDPDGFQKSNPVFNVKKLDWFNGQYIRQKTDEELAELFRSFVPTEEKLDLIVPLVKDRIGKLSEINTLAGFFYNEPEPDTKLLSAKARDHLSRALGALETDEYEANKLNKRFEEAISEGGFKTGEFFMDLRIAITGARVSPPLTESMMILGKEASIKRIKNILEKI